MECDGDPIWYIRVEPACVHCGRTCGNFAGGWGVIGNKPVCHPNEFNRPDCYKMIVTYNHKLTDCEECSKPWT